MPADIAETLAKLPAAPGITYRGLSGAPATSAITLSQVMPTSADPRVATENFTAERVVAIRPGIGKTEGQRSVAEAGPLRCPPALRELGQGSLRQ